MPERIDAPYPFYLWDQILDGNIYRCRRPADFATTAKTFVSYCRREALARNLVVDLKIEDEDSVVVRARKGDVQPRVQVAS